MLGQDINSIGEFMMDPDIINLINEYDSSIFGEEQSDQLMFVSNKIKSYTSSIDRLKNILDDIKRVLANPIVSSAVVQTLTNNFKEKSLPELFE